MCLVFYSSIAIKTDFTLIAKNHVSIRNTGQNSFLSRTIPMWNPLRADFVIFWPFCPLKSTKYRKIITEMR